MMLLVFLWFTETIGSMSSMEVNVDMLEQMDLIDMSDHEALDVFLNSGGEDNSVASPLLGIHTYSDQLFPNHQYLLTLKVFLLCRVSFLSGARLISIHLNHS